VRPAETLQSIRLRGQQLEVKTLVKALQLFTLGTVEVRWGRRTSTVSEQSVTVIEKTVSSRRKSSIELIRALSVIFPCTGSGGYLGGWSRPRALDDGARGNLSILQRTTSDYWPRQTTIPPSIFSSATPDSTQRSRGPSDIHPPLLRTIKSTKAPALVWGGPARVSPSALSRMNQPWSPRW
jgi:hypothetical protein